MIDVSLLLRRRRATPHRSVVASATPTAGLGALVAALVVLLATAPPAEARRDKTSAKPMLQAQVTSVEDVAIENVRVTVKTDEGAVLAQGTTNSKGVVELEIDAPAGDYGVFLEADGWAPFDARLTFEPGMAEQVTFRLLDEAAGVRQRAVEKYNAGVEAHTAQDFETAKARFLEAIAIDADMPEAHLGLADVLLQIDEVDAAVEEIAIYRNLKPDDEAGQRMAFEIYRRAGKTDEAEALAAELGEENLSKDVAVHSYNQGAVASQKGEWNQALAHFEKAVDVDPELEAAWLGIASAAYYVDRVDRTREAADKLLELDPANENGLRFRFLALDTLRAPEAMDAWNAYYDVRPDDAAELLHKRADLDFRAGSNQTAIQALETLIAKDPDNPRAHYLLGLIYSQSDTAKAKVHLQRFVDLAPDDPEAPSAKDILSYL